MPRNTVTSLTIGEIAQKLGRPIHRIAYVVKARHITPHRRAGSLRLFDEEAVRQIDHELKEMDARKGVTK